MTVFLDANIVIYLVEGAEPFRQQVQSVLRELTERQTGASFAVSRLSVLECLVKPVREGDTAVIDRYRAFFSAADLKIVEVTAPVVEAALLLRAHRSLRTPDAVQAACALCLKPPITFLTGDRIFKGIPGLQVRVIT